MTDEKFITTFINHKPWILFKEFIYGILGTIKFAYSFIGQFNALEDICHRITNDDIAANIYKTRV